MNEKNGRAYFSMAGVSHTKICTSVFFHSYLNETKKKSTVSPYNLISNHFHAKLNEKQLRNEGKFKFIRKRKNKLTNGQGGIFTLVNDFLRWTYFGPTRFIHLWTTLVHATIRVSNVIDKSNCWLADLMFDWLHVIVTAVERNTQTRRIITFLRRLFARFK